MSVRNMELTNVDLPSPEAPEKDKNQQMTFILIELTYYHQTELKSFPDSFVVDLVWEQTKPNKLLSAEVHL